ncbi:hypothetical protein M426DRAFT_24364 [Hypoxylon sp. CI-4A]|nr:hypothetical protein M426DRAFT_24364 [Hypoxylon sp. CI-4A]
MASTTFDPRNQTFFILGLPNDTTTSTTTTTTTDANLPLLAISMPTIDAQRVRLANTSINYGVQLGLCLFSLLTTLLLLPSRKLRRPVHVAQVSCLAVAATRLVLLVLYFPGPLTEYYVAWTRDASVLAPHGYDDTTASSALSVLQLALAEAALALQSQVLVRTWGSRGGASTAATAGKCWWRPLVLCFAVVLAAAAVGLRAIWIAHYTEALKGHTLPVPLDAVGKAAVVVGAASVFYFCGVFFTHLALHLVATRRILRSKKRKFSITLTLRGANGRGRGLTSLEILAVGNGILMLAPCLFAGLDVAAGPGNTRVLPFDAGSWVLTLVAAGLPLISIAAFYRGSDAGSSRPRRSYQGRWPSQERGGRGNRHPVSSFLASEDTTLPLPSPFHDHVLPTSSKSREEETISSVRGWDLRSPVYGVDVENLDLESGNVRLEPQRSDGEKEQSKDI